MIGKLFLREGYWVVKYTVWDDDAEHELPIYPPSLTETKYVSNEEVEFEIYMDKEKPELKYARLKP